MFNFLQNNLNNKNNSNIKNDENNKKCNIKYIFKDQVITNKITCVDLKKYYTNDKIIPNSVMKIHNIYIRNKKIMLPNSIKYIFGQNLTKKFNMPHKILHILHYNNTYFNHKCVSNILFIHSSHIPLYSIYFKKKYITLFLLTNVPKVKLDDYCEIATATRRRYLNVMRSKNLANKFIKTTNKFIKTTNKCIRFIKFIKKTSVRYIRNLFKTNK